MTVHEDGLRRQPEAGSNGRTARPHQRVQRVLGRALTDDNSMKVGFVCRLDTGGNAGEGRIMVPSAPIGSAPAST